MQENKRATIIIYLSDTIEFFFYYHFDLLACTYQKAQDTVHNKNTYNETSIQSYLFETKQSNQSNYVMRMLTETGLGSYWMDTVGKSDE